MEASADMTAVEDNMTAPITWTPEGTAALQRLGTRLFATTTETAAIFRYDTRTVRRAIEAGEIPAVRAGTTWRVPTAWIRAQIDLGMDAGRSGEPAPPAA
jgi:excisionase family DNA binding protein